MHWTTDRRAAVERLAAATARHDRLHGTHLDPRTTSDAEQHTHRERCRKAEATVRNAVTDANRDGVPVDTIAATTGFSPGYVRMILDREHAPPSRGWAHRVPGDRAAGPPP
ncbi:hypothetical protein [Embleya sp. AB8]|uniref:hypothetical protein n=1 Tax=Embleya sp. AB8 TaxID=3156304 RepID=UPI003C708D15